MNELIQQLQSLDGQISTTAHSLAAAIEDELRSKMPYLLCAGWYGRFDFFVTILDVPDADLSVLEAFFEAYKIEGIDLYPAIKSPETTEQYYTDLRAQIQKEIQERSRG